MGGLSVFQNNVQQLVTKVSGGGGAAKII